MSFAPPKSKTTPRGARGASAGRSRPSSAVATRVPTQRRAVSATRRASGAAVSSATKSSATKTRERPAIQRERPPVVKGTGKQGKTLSGARPRELRGAKGMWGKKEERPRLSAQELQQRSTEAAEQRMETNLKELRVSCFANSSCL